MNTVTVHYARLYVHARLPRVCVCVCLHVCFGVLQRAVYV